MVTPVGGIDAGDRAQGQASGSEGGTRSGPAAVTVVALRGAVSGLVVVTSVAAVVERHWLEGRTPWIAGLSAAVLAGLWGADRGWAARGGPLLATGATAAATVVAATSLGRRTATFSERVLADDLPPPAVYALTGAVGLACLGGLALVATTWRRRAQLQSGRLAGLTGGPVWRALGIAVLAVALFAPATVLAGGLSRGVADRRAEQQLSEHRFHHRAERLDETPGPVQLTERLWDVDLPGPPADEDLRVAPTTAEAIPGWDVVVVHQQEEWSSGATSRLIAYSKTDGDELWRYERGGGFLPTVDPASGRILLVSGEAAVVLSLEDGEELMTRRLPGDLSCGVHKGPVTEEYFTIAVGSTAVVGCSFIHLRHRVVLIDVATAQLRAQLEEDCASQYRSTATATPAVVLEISCILQQGPTRVLALDPDARRLESIAEVAPPPGSTAECELPCNDDLDLGEDLIVATLTWTHQSRSVDDDDCDDADPACRKFAELVALTREGEVRWRTEMVTDLAIEVAVMAVTEHGVLVRTDDSWRLLSLVDGSELARQPHRPDEVSAVTATDGQRIYTVGAESDTAVVRRLDDLSVVGTSSRTPAVRVGISRTNLFAVSGRLVYVTADERLVAYGER